MIGNIMFHLFGVGFSGYSNIFITYLQMISLRLIQVNINIMI
jgi:hypothetical protein